MTSRQPAAGSGPGLLARWNFNTVVALLVTAMGIAIVLLVPSQVEDPPRLFGMAPQGISPETFPTIVGGLFIATGLAYLATSFGLREVNGFATLTGQAAFNIGVVLALMFLYIVMLRPLGFIASSGITAIALSLYYGSRNPIGIGIVAIVIPVTVFYLFTRVLYVSLPPFPEF